MFKTNPDNAKIIGKLQAVLTEASISQVISYSDLNKAGGVDVQRNGRHLLHRARELAERDMACVFECVREQGVMRLPYERTPEVGLHVLHKVRKAARRGSRRLGRVRGNSMRESDQKLINGFRAMLNAVALVSDGRRAQIIAVVADPVRPIPPENILLMFKGKEE